MFKRKMGKLELSIWLLVGQAGVCFFSYYMASHKRVPVELWLALLLASILGLVITGFASPFFITSQDEPADANSKPEE
ncbi:MAG: hypothetical protein L0331_05875 [Chloroflexi bacterium]|nr:hypothetical protein [Chloroflexota bacterium]